MTRDDTKVDTSPFDGDISTPEKALAMARHFAEEYKFNSDERGFMGALLGLLVYERDVTLPKVTAERDELREHFAKAAQHIADRALERKQQDWLNLQAAKTMRELTTAAMSERDALLARVKELEAGLENLAFHSDACASRKVSDMQRELTRKSIERARALIGKEPSK